eukprot:470273-Pyramimonas_sp.AAC.1
MGVASIPPFWGGRAKSWVHSAMVGRESGSRLKSRRRGPTPLDANSRHILHSSCASPRRCAS